MTTTTNLTIGQTVRWAGELARAWHRGRAADGVASANGAGIGRVTARYDDEGFCALCEHAARRCPGPWYEIDFGDGPSSGFGGIYGACELEPA